MKEMNKKMSEIKSELNVVKSEIDKIKRELDRLESLEIRQNDEVQSLKRRVSAFVANVADELGVKEYLIDGE
ncbi:MAG: hypothetical protein CME38_05145 [Haliea sp.]|nr:hypothetical protein [Haliea sp.]|tara:strand:- start:1976 stop:2191 length:216 start_codon:yes stop_codon:yes gene_type:complete